MQPIAIFFWGLVLATTGVTVRWGALVGLMFFMLILFVGVELLAKGHAI